MPRADAYGCVLSRGGANDARNRSGDEMSWQSDHRKNMRYATAGIEFIVTFALPLAGGMWLDFRLDTTPGLTILAGVLGFVVAVRMLFRKGRKIVNDSPTGRPSDEGGQVD